MVFENRERFVFWNCNSEWIHFLTGKEEISDTNPTVLNKKVDSQMKGSAFWLYKDSWHDMHFPSSQVACPICNILYVLEIITLLRKSFSSKSWQEKLNYTYVVEMDEL